ncbi:bifunctional adenosylcobinamide kinase/adenosylcobinamide-phosphate guanylyltransferase [Natranaerobius trueperi]|nr:bifunctional adenosylcobinamide kinase/adenosylcobinamide-phosphate guanylyltransferase [Natranaerobius trueperi]
MGKLILVTGGSASGKSKYAENLITEMERNFSNPKTTYIATAKMVDDEMKRRIKKHQERRPTHWNTELACYDLILPLKKLSKTEDNILLDSLSMYLSNKLLSFDEKKTSELFSQVIKDLSEVSDICENSNSTVVIVTDEIGWGLIPANSMGRTFRDLLGEANQILASKASEVYLVVCGIPQRIK